MLPANRYRPGARQRGEDTRRRILETALSLFAAEGFDSASTRAIAEQAEVNLPAIQYYFGSKEGLYRAAIAHIGEQAAQAIAPIAARVQTALDTGPTSRARLIDLLCEMVDALVTLFLDDNLPGRESRSLFVSRVEIEHTAALDPLNEVMRQKVLAPTSALVGRLVDRPADDEQVVLRTLMNSWPGKDLLQPFGGSRARLGDHRRMPYRYGEDARASAHARDLPLAQEHRGMNRPPPPHSPANRGLPARSPAARGLRGGTELSAACRA